MPFIFISLDDGNGQTLAFINAYIVALVQCDYTVYYVLSENGKTVLYFTTIQTLNSICNMPC